MIPPYHLRDHPADPVTEGPAQWLSPSLPAPKGLSISRGTGRNSQGSHAVLGRSYVSICHDPQHSGACWTYFPRPRTRCVDPRSILAEQRTMPDEATKVGMRNTYAHICAPSLFRSQRVYIYLTRTGNFPSLEIN